MFKAHAGRIYCLWFPISPYRKKGELGGRHSKSSSVVPATTLPPKAWREVGQQKPAYGP